MNDLISVIVPIYNVEKYLANCVESIIHQTYTNLEIILVNDGSLDRCGEIVDQYSKKDNRIKIIHKKNSGLADARNAGIDIAQGKYFMFVDSDDYISLDCIEYLYYSLVRTGSDISIGRLKCTALLNEIARGQEKTNIIYGRFEAINQLLYANQYSVAAPGKLYSAPLFKKIRFPSGKLYEDTFTTYKVFLKANKIYYGDKLVYFYYHRPGSIMLSSFIPKRLHIIEALEQIEKDMPLLEYGCEKGFASQNVEAMFMLLALNPRKEIINEYGIWTRVKRYRMTVLIDRKASKRVRGYALISFLGCHVATAIYRKYLNMKWM